MAENKLQIYEGLRMKSNKQTNLWKRDRRRARKDFNQMDEVWRRMENMYILLLEMDEQLWCNGNKQILIHVEKGNVWTENDLNKHLQNMFIYNFRSHSLRCINEELMNVLSKQKGKEPLVILCIICTSHKQSKDIFMDNNIVLKF